SCRQGVFVVVLLALGYKARRSVDQCDLRWEEVTEQPGNAPRDIDARATHGGAWQNLDAGDAGRGAMPNRVAAHEREPLSDLLAAGPERGAAPQVDDEGARHLAVGLEIEADHLVGGKATEFHCGRRGQQARVGREEIAPGGQHVAAATL